MSFNTLANVAGLTGWQPVPTPLAPASGPPRGGAAPRRILIGKPGLDGHDRGAKYIVHLLRDAGYEVIYTGIRRTPEEIVAAAIQEDVDAIGLSVLSGAHLSLFNRVIELLREQQASDIVLFGGGIIPAADVQRLIDAGVAAVFTPGTSSREILDTLARRLPVRGKP